VKELLDKLLLNVFDCMAGINNLGREGING
jgi:hypothetical protein